MYDHLLNQKITIHDSTGTDDYSNDTYGDGVELKARIELVNKSMTTGAGEVIPIMAQIWISPRTDVRFDVGDKVVYGGVNYRVVGKTTTPGMTGAPEFIKLDCSEWR